MKCGKIQKFSIAIKIKPKIKSLTTLDMQRMKFGKIQKFSVVLKTWLKNESVAHSEPAKDKIWQNPEKFWFVLKIWFKNQIFDHSRPVKDEIWQNPDIFSRIANLACNRDFDHSWPAKDEILQNQEILIRVKNLTQNWHFWPLGTCKGWNVAKFRNFQSQSKSSPKLRVLTTLDMQRMKFGKIHKFSVTLKIWLKNESVDHSEPAKDEIWQNPEKFWFVLKIWLKK